MTNGCRSAQVFGAQLTGEAKFVDAWLPSMYWSFG